MIHLTPFIIVVAIFFFFFLKSSAFVQGRVNNGYVMTHGRVVPKQTKKYKLTVTVQKEVDNEMGQIDQISVDQVKARQRF